MYIALSFQNDYGNSGILEHWYVSSYMTDNSCVYLYIRTYVYIMYIYVHIYSI